MMLINCPRCGFSQPQDQYCAQCGVDMQAFKPKKKPLWENPVLQIAVIAIIAALLIKNILGNSATSRLGKRTQHSQGYTRSERKGGGGGDSLDSAGESAFASSSGADSNERDSTRAKNSRESAATDDKTAAANLTGAGTALGDSASGQAIAGSVNFKLTYAEAAPEVVNKWIFDSNNLGFYQSMPEYSVGILYDFKKRGDTFKQTLKTADLKVAPGSSAVNLSGIMSDDGSTLIGIATTVEYKTTDADGLHGSILVTKNSRQGADNFPSEFELPKGAALFILGALKTDNFASERSKLQMPPFQIFKSPDFMTHKAEFVIILEPDYK